MPAFCRREQAIKAQFSRVVAIGGTISEVIFESVRQIVLIVCLKQSVSEKPIGEEPMKRTSFSALVTALSFLVAGGSVVTAQQFSSTGHSAFNSVAAVAQHRIASQLSISQDPGLAVAPGALPTQTPSVTVLPPGSGSRIAAPQQVQVLPPQGSDSRQVAPQFQSTPQQALSLPAAVSPNPIRVSPPVASQNYTPPQFAPGPSGTLDAPATQGFATNGSSFNSVMQSAPVAQSAPVFQSVVQDPTGQGGYGDVAQSFPVDESQFVQDGDSGLRKTLVRRRPPGSVYSTVGVSGLVFNRNVGDNRNFSANADGGLLASNNTDDTVLGGIDAFIARRKANGNGWEARYFGLYPNDESTQIGNDARHLIPGYDQIGTSVSNIAQLQTGPSAGDIFNLADTHVLTRQTELQNAEFNILRRSVPRFRAAQTEYLLGFRYFQFGETLLHEAVDIPRGNSALTTPESIGYFSSVENTLLGLQVGSRSDFRLHRRLLMHLSVKAGAFNNNVKTRQRVDYRLRDGSTINPTVVGGTLAGERFDIGAEDDVKSILAEVDISFSYQLSESSRFRAGYRALGVTDIAFASDQVQDDFSDALGLRSPNSDETLVAQGAYFGLEFAY